MKKFIIQVVIFSFIIALLFNAKSLHIVITEEYKKIVAGFEIYHSIEKSKKKKNEKTKVLVIGDSVGKQLFDNYTYNSDSINSLACNQAVSMVGQYILLHNYLEAGNSVEKVILLYAPFSFANNLNQVFTFHYFLKPFLSFSNLRHLTFTANKQILKIPKFYYAKIPNVLITNWAPNYTPKSDDIYFFLSPLSIEYLNKIKDLSAKHNFKLILLPTPSAQSNRVHIENMTKLTEDIAKTSLVTEFNSFFENIIFLPDSCFHKDKVHLLNPKKMTQIYERSINNMDKNGNKIVLKNL